MGKSQYWGDWQNKENLHAEHHSVRLNYCPMDINSSDRPFLIFVSPLIEQSEIDEVVACMESAWLGTGPRVAQFERDFAAYKDLQPSQVAAVNSATAALHVSMVAAGLEPGTEVV